MVAKSAKVYEFGIYEHDTKYEKYFGTFLELYTGKMRILEK